jgi:hypothetical protein
MIKKNKNPWQKKTMEYKNIQLLFKDPFPWVLQTRL